jgi:sporulation integral membrane protein YtvI
MTQAYWFQVLLRTLIVLLVTTGIILVAYFLYPLIYPFVIAWVIAMLLEPLVDWLEKKTPIPRWLAVFISLLLLLGIISSFTIYLISEIVVTLANLAQKLPEFFKRITQTFMDSFQENKSFNTIVETVQDYLNKNPQQQESITNSISNNIDLMAQKTSELISNLISGIGTFFGDLPYFITVFVVIILATFFISLDWPKIKKNMYDFMPTHLQDTSRLVIDGLKRALYGFIIAQLTLITITGLIMLVGLYVLKVEHAISIAFFIALIDLLPYFGVGAVIVPWSIYLFLIDNINLAVGLLVVYTIIIIVRQFLEPKLVADHVGLDPLVTLISLFIGLKLFGVFGLIIGPVLTVILLTLTQANVFRDLWFYIVGKNKVKTQTTN